MLPQTREKGTETHGSLSGLQKVTVPAPQYRIQFPLLLENENPTRAKKSEAPTAGQSRERETQLLPPPTAPPLPSS